MKTIGMCFLAGLLPVLTAACGGGANQNADGSVGGGAWLPLKVGNSWTYQVTAIDATVSVKVQSVVTEEPVGGDGDSKTTKAFKLVTGNKFDDPNGDISYQAQVGSRLVRFRELSIDGKTGALKKEDYYAEPWKLRVDGSAMNTTLGTVWVESYQAFVIDTPKVPATVVDGGAADNDAGAGTSDAGLVTTSTQVQETWEVTGSDELVTVAAGTFKALMVNRIAEGTNRTYWFARGIGKVKETGIGEATEELTSYIVTP
jgi:hypothetical protein